MIKPFIFGCPTWTELGQMSLLYKCSNIFLNLFKSFIKTEKDRIFKTSDVMFIIFYQCI